MNSRDPQFRQTKQQGRSPFEMLAPSRVPTSRNIYLTARGVRTSIGACALSLIPITASCLKRNQKWTVLPPANTIDAASQLPSRYVLYGGRSIFDGKKAISDPRRRKAAVGTRGSRHVYGSVPALMTTALLLSMMSGATHLQLVP